MIELRYSLVIEATDDPVFLDSTRRTSQDLRGSGIPLKTACTKLSGALKITRPC